jgi:hypothetical protein
MQSLFAALERPLPETLLDDLQELVTWDNNAYLTWVGLSTEEDPDGSRWFSAKFSSDGETFGLRLEFWIPEWMTERALAAILPAHLGVDGFTRGVEGAVEVSRGRWPEVRAGLPRVARTCARLINELWGRTDSDGVLLLTIDYQEERLEIPFTELPGFGGRQ